MDAITECEPLVEAIGKKLQEKRSRLDEIEVEILQLEEQDGYDVIPSESWEGRNGGEKRYLRLVFPTEYGRRRREYVGSDPARIEASREKVERTKLLLSLQAEKRRINTYALNGRDALRRALTYLEGRRLW